MNIAEFDSRADLLVDTFCQSSLRKKDPKRSKATNNKSPRANSTNEDAKPERPTCQGPTLRFMQKVFLSEAVTVASRQEQLPAYLDNEFIVKCLVWHNILRARHQAKPLQLSFDLCHEAQKMANEIAHTDRIFHRSKSLSIDAGENLYVKYQPLLLIDSQMDVTAKEVTKHWYHRGVRRYDHSLSPDVLHTQGSNFTQIVWRSSRSLGIGKARSIHNEAKVIVVALYHPHGNLPGHFLDNVKPEIRAVTTPEDSDEKL